MSRRTGVPPSILAVLILGISTAYADPGRWRLSLGPVYRNGMDMEIRGSSYVQSLGLHAANPYRRDPAGVRDRNAYRDRTYDDGFVNIDVATATDGQTWFWGWEDRDQFDGGRQTLSFRRRGGVRVKRETLLDEGVDTDEELSGVGIAGMAARRISWPAIVKRGAEVELCFGAQGVWNEEARYRGTTYRERITRERHTVIDRYDVGYDLTATAAHPPPYEGTFLGPGPLIPNKPSRRDRRVRSRTIWEAENRLDIEVESDLYEFWFGPRISAQPVGTVTIYCIPNVSVNHVSMDIDRDEQFVTVYSDGRTGTLGSWNDSKCEGEWLFGAGVEAGAEVDLNDGWFAGTFGGYDWISDDAEVDIGPNTITIDPSGYTVGVAVGRKL
jgi:hypothetical protein